MSAMEYTTILSCLKLSHPAESGAGRKDEPAGEARGVPLELARPWFRRWRPSRAFFGWLRT
ncbi:hypothetical protein HNR42_002109 [Deinobacterium chartae]|uniref:Uncharacterized protein n=1 Tax=Deinobacterium chartae TaxID=521158 RepID=A0A841I116_9DEIO|nr:hypothetical protein [Deinobacterium chartae]